MIGGFREAWFARDEPAWRRKPRRGVPLNVPVGDMEL